MTSDFSRSTNASRRRRRTIGVLSGALLAAGVSASVGVGPSNAVVPGANGLIAFESNRDGTNDIFVMNSDGTIEVNLTQHPANDVYPVWSHDSTKILFASDRHQTNNLDVYRMNVDGSGVAQLTNSPGEDRGASYTSDGSTIVFHSARNRAASGHSFDVFKMDANGDNETMIFPNGSAAYACGDSTNGVIVFNSASDPVGENPPIGTNPTTGAPIYDFEIFTMDLNGGSVDQITDNTVLDSGPKWSPDCSTISYNSLDTGGSLDVHRVAANGSGDINLTNAPGIFDAFSAFSPDGQEIVFSSNREVNFEMFKMSSANGADVERLTFTKKGDADLRGDWGTAPDRQIPPYDKNQCKEDGWTDFSTPTFADQGECIDFVNAL
jgi:Tol biopolymer transport system component